MLLAKGAGKSPRVIAEEISVALQSNAYIDEVSIAGPGFLNIVLSNAFYLDIAKQLSAGDETRFASSLLLPESERKNISVE